MSDSFPPTEASPRAAFPAAPRAALPGVRPLAPLPARELPGRPDEPGHGFPIQPLLHLDTLWIQVAGTLCNLSCTHCFVTSGPGIQRHRPVPRAAARGPVPAAPA